MSGSRFLEVSALRLPGWVERYVSARAGAVLLLIAYGKDGFNITLTNAAVPGVVLNYTSWDQITDDIDDARIYGGIHFRFDQEDGSKMGREIARYVYRHNLRPQHGKDR